MNNNKLNDQELDAVSGGSLILDSAQKTDFCIADMKGNIVASFTTQEEAQEAFDQYGAGYHIITRIL
ncbi:MAG: hypothetical protein J5966_06825 [Lachnospiraceae bacterium]|nr:hypothetical protein [Lachnospiraceae bacterium]